MDCSTRKLAKWGDYQLRVSFNLENGPVFPLGPTGSIVKVFYQLRGLFHLENALVCLSGPTDYIAKVLIDVHKNFWKNHIRNMDHQKIH
ncbi:hypothetical protein H5410_056427 [Solanum commersonii]|uniref:Uncharacterized protein n=1 Tax=Solanum commersonii TaxID=4109 RepID=A0A9J5WLP2_SOLCO|nr:hypothetical protein H5410_056427 [Solanum commersonii]